MSLTAEQLAVRATGIGGSEAPAALGLSHWGSALELYREKRGEVARQDLSLSRPWVLWGQLLEPVIRQQYSERTGRVVRLPVETLRHPQHPFMVGHPDGVTDDGRLYEGKIAVRSDEWGEPGSDQIPRPYLIQLQHYLAILGLEVADVAVLIGNCDFRMYEVPADKELQGMIIEGEAAFWDRVERADPPPPDWESPRVLEVVKALHPGTDGSRLAATGQLVAWYDVLNEARERARVYQQAADSALAHLLFEMGPAATLSFPDGKLLRRKLTKRKGYTVEATEYMDTRFVNDKESNA